MLLLSPEEQVSRTYTRKLREAILAAEITRQFSKDEILVAAFEHNRLIYYIGVIVAGLTAFYMFRLYFGIFWGKETNRTCVRKS